MALICGIGARMRACTTLTSHNVPFIKSFDLLIEKCWTGSISEIKLCGMAMRTTAVLPDDLITLKALIVHERATHTTALSARDEEIERLRAQMRVLLAQRFGTMRGKNIVSIWNCDEFLLEKN